MQESGIVFANRKDDYMLTYINGVVYAKRPNKNLEMRLILHKARFHEPIKTSAFSRDSMDPAFGNFEPHMYRPDNNINIKYPVLIHVQGSGFQGTHNFGGLPMFCDIARRGFVLVDIDYRGAQSDDARFPDAVQDCKEAIRFLKANADEFFIDKDRITLIGNSSGAHNVMMTALTDGDTSFDIGDNLEYSSTVKAVIDQFGPMDYEHMVEDRRNIGQEVGHLPEEAYSLFRNDVVANPSLLKVVSVINYITPEKNIPPILILHGDEDTVVPYAQSLRLYQKLKHLGKQVELYKIIGAGHGTHFWSKRVMELIGDFLEAYV